MQADDATVYGPLENPTRVLITGQPARIWVKNKGIERDVMAEANEIEYARNLDVVRLRGNARIVEGGRRSLAGEYFEYDLKTDKVSRGGRSEEHTSELQSLMSISYAVFCLKKKK